MLKITKENCTVGPPVGAFNPDYQAPPGSAPPPGSVPPSNSADYDKKKGPEQTTRLENLPPIFEHGNVLAFSSQLTNRFLRADEIGFVLFYFVVFPLFFFLV